MVQYRWFTLFFVCLRIFLTQLLKHILFYSRKLIEEQKKLWDPHNNIDFAEASSAFQSMGYHIKRLDHSSKAYPIQVALVKELGVLNHLMEVILSIRRSR
jgi:hypothetical protein